MFKKATVAVSVLFLIAAAFIFVNTVNLMKSPVAPKADLPESGEMLVSPPLQTPTSTSAQNTPAGPEADIPLDKVDTQSANEAYGKASSMAIRTPELDDIKTLIPVLLKFSPAELSTLTRLASRTMTKDEINQAKSILLSKLNQDEVNLLLRLGPKYGLDFRAVLGASDKPKK